MIGQNLITHAEAYGVSAIAFLVAAGKSMPPKLPSWREVPQWLWTWLFETVQTVLPTPRSKDQNPSQPEAPAQTK
jgi:hypothetical protein